MQIECEYERNRHETLVEVQDLPCPEKYFVKPDIRALGEDKEQNSSREHSQTCMLVTDPLPAECFIVLRIFVQAENHEKKRNKRRFSEKPEGRYPAEEKSDSNGGADAREQRKREKPICQPEVGVPSGNALKRVREALEREQYHLINYAERNPHSLTLLIQGGRMNALEQK